MCQIPSTALADYLQQHTQKALILPLILSSCAAKKSLSFIASNSTSLLVRFHKRDYTTYGHQALKSKGQIHPNIQASASHSVRNKL